MTPTLPKTEPAAVLPQGATAAKESRIGIQWGPALEAVAIPTGAVIAATLLFGVFCFTQNKNPFAVFAAIYKAAFGSWYAFQNTLVRAAPLMLTALCTALPARLGLVIIGNEGALVMGGLGAVALGLSLDTASPNVAWAGMVIGAICGGGLWITIVGLLRYQRAVNE